MPGIPGAAMTAASALLLVEATETSRDRCVGRAKKCGTGNAPFQMPSGKSEGWEVRGRNTVHGGTAFASAIKRETLTARRSGGSPVLGQIDTQELSPTSNSKALEMECNLDLLPSKGVKQSSHSRQFFPETITEARQAHDSLQGQTWRSKLR